IIDEYKSKFGIPQWNSIIKSDELDWLVKERARKNYWDAHRLGEIKNQSVAEALADWIFNSGHLNAVPPVQKYLGLTPDAVIGPKTIAAINKSNQKALHKAITEARVNFIENSKRLIKIKDQLIDRARSFFFQEQQ
ncbi:MAG: hypothetical protein MUE72_11580, partial [Chitinophagaceae bacterium]|nr:hypothetical protein [Chitinophagaceae bacterium]